MPNTTLDKAIAAVPKFRDRISLFTKKLRLAQYADGSIYDYRLKFAHTFYQSSITNHHQSVITCLLETMQKTDIFHHNIMITVIADVLRSVFLSPFRRDEAYLVSNYHN